jgi:hypothetical protein
VQHFSPHTERLIGGKDHRSFSDGDHSPHGTEHWQRRGHSLSIRSRRSRGREDECRRTTIGRREARGRYWTLGRTTAVLATREKLQRPSWRLVWQVAPANAPAELFIPIGRRQPTGEMRYPRAKGQLSKLLYQLASSEGAGKERVPFSATDLKIGNLQRLPREARVLAVDWALVGPNKSGSFEWADPQPSKSVLISVRFTDSTC